MKIDTIKKACVSLFFILGISMISTAQTVNGLVVDVNGLPMPGVVVKADVSGIGTSTNAEGHFQLALKENDQSLSFSFVGYQPKEVKIGGRTTINVVMREATQELGDVVVVGYGHQKKVSVTGAISTTPVENLTSIPVVTLSNAVGGQLQGVTTRNTSGEPGADASILIRGMGTWTDATPLILVDGVERDINLVNPHDVESISVLKDASATAVYGVRGANGVVLINTKKGRAGAPHVTFRTEYAIRQGTRFPDYIDGYEFASLMNEACENEGKPIPWTEYDLQTFRDGSDPYMYPNVNWTDAVYKHVTDQMINTLSVSGGSERVKYYLSARQTSEGGLYNTDKSLDYDTNARLHRYNLLSNIDVNVTRDLSLSLGLSSSIQHRTYPGRSSGDIYNQTKYTSPIEIPQQNPDGSVSGTATMDNPWAMATQSGYQTMYINTLQGTFSARLDLSRFVTKGLALSGKFSFDSYGAAWTNRLIAYKRFRYDGVDALEGEDIYFDLEPTRSGAMVTSTASAATRQTYLDFAVNYDRTFAAHQVGAMLVANRQEKINMLAGNEMENIPRRSQGIAFRTTYNYDNRYFLEVNAGYNGSENFKKGHRYGFFPAVSAGWMLTNEKFWHVDAISKLKLRISHGKVGNDYMGTRFAYLTTINKYAAGYPWGSSQISEGGYSEGQTGSDDVTWETAVKTNAGLDLALFNNLINLQVDFFLEKRSGIFLQRQSVPTFAGYQGGALPYANLGKVDNKGFDVRLEINKRTDWGLQYSLFGTFSFARNKIVENDIPPQRYDYLNSQGHRIGQVWGLESLGFFTNDDIATIASEDVLVNSGAMDNCDRTIPKQTFQTTVREGDLRYKDQNGDGIINDDDRVAIGYGSIPEIMYGFGGTVKYKAWDFTIFFNGVGHRTNFLDGASMMPFSLEYPAYNVLREYYDNRYIPATADNPTPDNSHAKYPAVIAANNPNNYRTSTQYMRSAAYLRLQNLEIGYSLPSVLLKRVGISQLRIFANGDNLLVWDKIKIIDPEMDQTGTYPKQRVINMGVQIDF